MRTPRVDPAFGSTSPCYGKAKEQCIDRDCYPIGPLRPKLRELFGVKAGRSQTVLD